MALIFHGIPDNITLTSTILHSSSTRAIFSGIPFKAVQYYIYIMNNILDLRWLAHCHWQCVQNSWRLTTQPTTTQLVQVSPGALLPIRHLFPITHKIASKHFLYAQVFALWICCENTNLKKKFTVESHFNCH